MITRSEERELERLIGASISVLNEQAPEGDVYRFRVVDGSVMAGGVDDHPRRKEFVSVHELIECGVLDRNWNESTRQSNTNLSHVLVAIHDSKGMPRPNLLTDMDTPYHQPTS